MPLLRKLILMRHGEARQEGNSDKARTLSPHGVRQSQEVGQSLRESVSQCDKAVVSEAARTKQTAENVLASFAAKATCFESLLYTANDESEFTQALSRNITNEDLVVLVIGHNPIISSMASFLTGVNYGFATSEFAILNIEADDWLTALQSRGCWTSVT